MSYFPRTSERLKYGLIALAVVLIAIWLAHRAFPAAAAPHPLTMASIMTPAELSETGVSTLNAVQRKQLDLWLNRYSVNLLDMIAGSSCRDWDRDSVGTVTSNGSIVTTYAGAAFRVSLGDEIDAEGWEPSDSLLVHCFRASCTLINLDQDGDTIGASLLR